MSTTTAGFVTTDDLDARATLARAAQVVRERRAAEVEDLELVLHWADLHAWDPKAGSHRLSFGSGGNRLIEVGGDGTPLVQDLCLPELAVAREVHVLSVRSLVADALDLRHRLPSVWHLVAELECEPWLARRVARLSRDLDRVAVGTVDGAVAEAIAGESPGRVLAICEAKVIEADRDAHAARLAEQLRRRFVSLGRTDEHGLRHVIGRVEAGEAVWLDAILERVAEALDGRRDLVPDLPTDASRDELRAVALGWLAHPADVLALLDPASDAPRRPRRTAVLYVHLHQAALEGGAGVARVEGVGPMLLEQVRRLLAHARVELKPVIDLATGADTNAYEHPEALRERVHLRGPGDVFPHATTTSRLVDLDHVVPFERHGPPGQTNDANTAPLARTSHRAKTHLAYRLTTREPGEYVWTTPHGLHRHVDATGTHVLDSAQALELAHPGALHGALDRIRGTLGS